ncbi:uncharacterized protein LOC144597950 isoform X2 [Rhinoraja longicauda]
MMSQRPLPVAEDLPVLPNANEGPKSIPDTMPSTSSNPKATPTTSFQNIENKCIQSVGIGGLINQSTSLTDPKTMKALEQNQSAGSTIINMEDETLPIKERKLKQLHPKFMSFRRRSRRNGWTWPLHPYQLTCWVLYL